ncbi:MAG TPA: AraC family transcriptional regulator [Chitinophagaceae bacterium]|nr:AraC family transcriptional regulator [Chitinophagaceae bacterium]
MKPILRKVDTGNNSFSIKEDIYPHLYNHWHYHPEVELTLIRKGTGMRLVGDNIEQFKDNDLVLLGANLPHLWRSDAAYFKNDPELFVEAVAIHFKKDFWGSDFLELPEMKHIKAVLEKAKRGIKITGKTKRLLLPKMEAALQAGDAARIILLIEMLATIATSKDYKFLASAVFLKSYSLATTDKINTIYDYTFTHFQKELSIKEIAKVANLSPHSFCRYFKTRTLKTYWQFLLEVRIGYACKLLIENKLTVARICYECGFNNLSNFNRHFKDITKVTPLQYGKQYLGTVID